MKLMAFDTSERRNFSSAGGAVSRPLLRWYEKNARDLPWRTGPKARKAGKRPDPYHVWLSEIMLQQTTVATVAQRYQEFLTRWPSVAALAAAPLEDVLGAWAGLGYSARARNLHKCARQVAGLGVFPDTEETLKKLPGVGDYTAAAIAAIAFDRRAVVVDGNIERIVSRLFMIEVPLPKAKSEIRERADGLWPKTRSGDFAQGLMDLGAGVCRPKSPSCLLCPLSDHCAARAMGRVEEFPVKAKKKPKPQRRGAVFALTNARGEMLFERRPEKGMLGGMLGLPGTPWADKAYTELPGDVFQFAPAKAEWNRIGGAAHSFTHFDLMLEVYAAGAPTGFRRKADQEWIKPDEAKLPTVMKKAVKAAVAS